MGKTEMPAQNAMTDKVPNRRSAPPVRATLPPPLPRSRAPQATREQVAQRIPTEAINVAARIEAVSAIDVREIDSRDVDLQDDAELAELPPVRVRFAPRPRGTTIPPLPGSRMPAGTLPPPIPARARASSPLPAQSMTAPVPSLAKSSPRTTLPPPVPTRTPAMPVASPATSTVPSAPISSAERSSASGSIQTPPPVGPADETTRTPVVDLGEPKVLFTTEAPKRAAVGTFPPPLRTTRAKSPELFMAPPSAATHSSAGLLLEKLERDAHTSSPFAPPRAPSGTLPPPVRTLPPQNAPVAAPFEKRADADEPWFEPTAAVHKRALDETWVGTLPSGKAEYLALAKRLAVPGLVCIAIGVGLGLYVSTGKRPHKGTPVAQTAPMSPATATTAPAPTPSSDETVLHPIPRSVESANAATASAGGEQPQPPTKAEQEATIAAAAAAESGATMTHEAPAQALANMATREVKTAHGTVTLTDVRIDSDPSGANVTLVDGGTQLPLGSTPLSTSVDISREYDVIVEVAGRPTQMVHLDPKTTARLDVALGREVTVAPEAKPETKTETKVIEPTPRKAKKAVHADDLETPAVTTADAAGNGTLMVSTKPPCEIVIDGKATGLTTPQRSIELAAGRHAIKFVNAEAGIDKTVTVKIRADKATKLIQDLMKK